MADVPGHPFLKVGHALLENRQSLGFFVDRFDPFVDPFAEIFANPRTGRVDFPRVGLKPPTSSRILLQRKRIVLWPCPSGNEPPVQGKGSFPEGHGHAI